MAVATETVETRVGPIEMRRGGSGRPLVYLHSAMGEGPGIELLDELAARFDLYAPMFCGFGESAGIEQIEDMEDVTFHLLDLFDRLGLEAPVLAGTSLGGWMAAELATRYPDRLAAMVLVNPAGLYIPGAEIKDIFGRAPSEMAADLFADHDHPIAQVMRTMEESFANLTAGMDIPFELVKPQIQAMAATARIAWNPYLHNPRLPGRLWRAAVPALVVRGEHDTLVPAAHCGRYAELLPDARIEVMERCAHMVPLERPADLAELIAGFSGSCS